ncbi:NAD(P)H-hydrate dehydratase [Olivibacter domesticus]|uniref:Bifunctional NAD(P)H-hydrate repair enzyme n=1 Tax=Olivibacter domesticus TaxID=407022 RepID=A0A1H7X7Q8_OLID1|nr:NAD(P)H-hydrate dehydratase [Olivibacter domesticus]SEM29695.1 NAD(P)H-hydrate epimerase [Olivibacter domesticus]
MRNIMTVSQTREADRFTIANEPVSTIDLMERASQAFVQKFISLFSDQRISVLICCGPGNNGGDGLAISRLLYEYGYSNIRVWIADFNGSRTDDFKVNFQRLSEIPIHVNELANTDNFEAIEAAIVIDALLGSGLNKPLEGALLNLVRHINASGKQVISVDIPSGMPADGNIMVETESIFARDVISFQRPKLSFFFPESAKSLRYFHTVDIGLDETYISALKTDFFEITEDDIRSALIKRSPFNHKGTFGHCLIFAGNINTMGAALLSAEASLYTGSGLTSLCIPPSGLSALNTRLPEAMALEREQLPSIRNLEKYAALAVGPGLGVGEDEKKYLRLLLNSKITSTVIDADALNILAQEGELFEQLKPGTIITPHMKEFDRLFGSSKNWWERTAKARENAVKRQIIIVLKNRYTFIAMPNGKVIINPTGNPGMASGGMGDVLCGMIGSLLAQGYAAEEAAMLACFLHGKAGDLLAEEGMAVIPPTMLIQKIPKVIGDFTL